MDLTVIYSLTLLQLISVYVVADSSTCCVGTCNGCNKNCNSCKQICDSCCKQGDCCPTRVDCCLHTCLSSGNPSSSTFAATSTTHSTGNSKLSTFAATSTTRTTGDSSSSIFASTSTTSSTDDSSSSTFTSSFASSFASTATSEVTGDFTDAKESSSPVVAAVVSSVGALCVVVVVVVGFLLLRRKQQSQGVRTEDSAICCSAAANPDDRQNSFHVYDRLSREHRRADNDKEPENKPDKTSKDDEYTYIDEATIIKMTGRLDEDHQPATTEHPTNANPSSGLHPDLSPTYRLAGAVNNGFTDPQPPDYFILENDEKGCAEPTQYFILEERGERSPADTDTQQYFTLEEGQEGAGRESASQFMSPGSGADYFELERPSDRQSDCAGVARHEESRGPPEDAEYSRLEPNGLEHSEYTLLTNPAHQVSTLGDNPYSLASGVQ